MNLAVDAQSFYPKESTKAPAAAAGNASLILNKSRTCMKQEEQMQACDTEKPKEFVSDPKKLERLQ